MAKSARRSAKGKAPVISSVSSSGASTPSSQSGPLPPFTIAPHSLTPFLDLLSPEGVYLVHIDTTTLEVKKQSFIVPSIINVFIIALLAVRIYMGRKVYPALLATVIGLTSSMNVDTAAMSWEEIGKITLRRAGPVIFDYFLVTLFLSWPIRFYYGPVKWRRKIGFRNHEIIVRCSQSRLSNSLERNRWIRENEEMRDKIVAAVTPDRIRKTGYLLVDADWDLDYNAMIMAHQLVDSTRDGSGLPLDEFRTAVLVNTDTDGWLIWHVGDENTEEGRTRSKQRDQILAFKEKLTEMGKEELFFRWVELIQYESTRPGGFTPERQESAMIQAKQLFEEADVDFARFWQEVGGMEGFADQLD
ncbi:hypothetical protein P175DRAFT_0500300 [Aspergillus ochraceoroseus IBT 24754]|uniref:Uncharacterized protein n=2 Tax=Aspergillus ochraceoroseus TaxID=138278 RepID=A0A2T5LYN7_9EURO|nr:uncharacterized protein P175DRAFT_0500300 [Aspergillus ochraceoroseus IBT 24754]KKK24009.1 hypothetical protein AOCH_007194 [Aspergillus ochraceoroseus]PTU21397.1 hypothetical protein P175DRAFT_0500300 [Aspergillus ochraceoroseus IBT 24754]